MPVNRALSSWEDVDVTEVGQALLGLRDTRMTVEQFTHRLQEHVLQHSHPWLYAAALFEAYCRPEHEVFRGYFSFLQQRYADIRSGRIVPPKMTMEEFDTGLALCNYGDLVRPLWN